MIFLIAAAVALILIIVHIFGAPVPLWAPVLILTLIAIATYAKL